MSVYESYVREAIQDFGRLGQRLGSQEVVVTDPVRVAMVRAGGGEPGIDGRRQAARVVDDMGANLGSQCARFGGSRRNDEDEVVRRLLGAHGSHGLREVLGAATESWHDDECPTWAHGATSGCGSTAACWRRWASSRASRLASTVTWRSTSRNLR